MTDQTIAGNQQTNPTDISLDINFDNIPKITNPEPTVVETINTDNFDLSGLAGIPPVKQEMQVSIETPVQQNIQIPVQQNQNTITQTNEIQQINTTPDTQQINTNTADTTIVADSSPITKEESTQSIQIQESIKPTTETKIEEIAKDQISDIKKKYDELNSHIKSIYNIQKSPEGSEIKILGANNDKMSIMYQFSTPNGDIKIIKTETNKETDEETINDLSLVFDNDGNSLNIILDDVLLFDESQHLQNDSKKKLQVMDKLNKFIFLTSEHLKKTEKEAKEKEAEEAERRRLQDIFRNF